MRLPQLALYLTQGGQLAKGYGERPDVSGFPADAGDLGVGLGCACQIPLGAVSTAKYKGDDAALQIAFGQELVCLVCELDSYGCFPAHIGT